MRKYYREKARRRRELYPEKVKDYAKKWREEHPEECRIFAQRTYQKNVEKIRDRARKNYEKNKESRKASMKEYSRKNRRTLRDAQLRRAYGITHDEYDARLERQGGRCGLCKNERAPGTRAFAVDHDHATGAIRGLLCKPCNTGLGCFKDNPELMEAGAQYVRAA